MKYPKYLLVLILAMAVVSCKSDDDQPTPFLLSVENLIGTYDVTFLETVEEETFIINGVPFESTITTVGDTFQLEFMFTSSSAYSISGEYRSSETTVVGQQPPVLDTSIVLVNDIGTYLLDANAQTLSFTLEGEVSELSVESFTETEMILVSEESEIINNLPYSYRTEIRMRRK